MTKYNYLLQLEMRGGEEKKDITLNILILWKQKQNHLDSEYLKGKTKDCEIKVFKSDLQNCKICKSKHSE